MESNNNQANNNEGELSPPVQLPPANPIPKRVIKPLDQTSRKHSNSDLQSRLKTRKLLGVGEIVGDNGDIYRSKISQVLGIHDNVSLKLPRGLYLWQTVLSAYLCISGFFCLAVPSFGGSFEIPNEGSLSETSVRLYGIAILCLAMVFRTLFQTAEDKTDVMTVLRVCIAFFGLQLMVTLISLISHGRGVNCGLYFVLAWRAAAAVGSFTYHELMDTRNGFIKYIRNCAEDFSTSPVDEHKLKTS